jgi:hypothetical protein
MSRSFDAADIVVLPVLDVSSAITLGGEMLTAVKSAEKTHKLPKAIKKSLVTVNDRHQSLRAASAERLSGAQATDGARTVRADRRLDTAWNAVLTWLSGWSKLPETAPQAAIARHIIDTIFADGLKFLLLAYKQEWAESDTRLLHMGNEKLDADIVKLGGAPFMDELRAAHLEYGEALGITATPDAPNTGANLRDALNAFLLALRTYVVRVSAHVDEEEAGSADLATLLLAPLTRWESSRTSGGQANDTDAATPTPEGADDKNEG